MATIKHVSEHAGVSQATVSRVINGTSRVSHDKKLKVEKAIKELGYRPNSIAQALASSRTGSVGIVVPELGGPFFSGILHCLEENLRRFGYHAVVTAGSNTEQGQRESVEFLLGRRVDALILHVQHLCDDYLIALEEQGIPVVLVNRFIPEMYQSCIDIDNELGANWRLNIFCSRGTPRLLVSQGLWISQTHGGVCRVTEVHWRKQAWSTTKRWSRRQGLPKRPVLSPPKNCSSVGADSARFLRRTITWLLVHLRCYAAQVSLSRRRCRWWDLTITFSLVT